MLSSLLPVLLKAQSFSVQCPASTALHPAGSTGPGAIKCQQVSGGDGFATMGDGNQIFLFGFGPLSGLSDIQNGGPGTETAAVFNSANDPNRALISVADIMNTGVMNAESPAPTMAIDEDDEFFLTLTNVGMIMRPDLFEQHTIHFHGYPNASSFFDGVPDASVAINIGGSFTYYYTAPDAGTYFWHCHIAPPEHLQMGMVGQLYVRPRQNKVSGDLFSALTKSNQVKGSADGLKCSDILCTGQTTAPANNTGAIGTPGTTLFAYNDGDGSTQYDVEYPIQIMGFDPNFHFVGMTFNPEGFADMKDKYHMLSGRSYPDTVTNSYMSTEGADGVSRPSQPVRSLITINKSGGQKRALLRISDLSVTNFTTLGTIGIPMTVIAQDARLLRDSLGNNMYFNTNSITIGGGQSTDVILDASNVPTGTYFLYSTNLDHLSNDAENFGGQMTEIHVQ
jgi:FtsP/CotA-like multicopper oxidase with cupredoxin domain